MPSSALFTVSCGSPGNRTVKLPSVFLYLSHSPVCAASGAAASNRIKVPDSSLRMVLPSLPKVQIAAQVWLNVPRFSHENPALASTAPVTAVTAASAGFRRAESGQEKARHGGGPVLLTNELTVRLLRGCALGHNLSGVLRQLFGLGQLVERRDYLRIVLRAHAQSFFLAKL